MGGGAAAREPDVGGWSGDGSATDNSGPSFWKRGRCWDGPGRRWWLLVATVAGLVWLDQLLLEVMMGNKQLLQPRPEFPFVSSAMWVNLLGSNRSALFHK